MTAITQQRAAARPNEAEIRQGVIEAVAGALDISADEVEPLASLVAELGAESLDFLDLTYRLEETFGIRMPRLNVLQRAESFSGAGTLLQAGRVTDLGLDLLRQTMNEVPPEHFKPGLQAYDVMGLLSAETFVRVVTRMLDAKDEMARACVDCGEPLAESSSAPELVCQGCGAAVPLPDGDEVLTADMAALLGK